MLSDQNKARLKLLLESVPQKVRLEIMMHIQMAEGQANARLTLSKELREILGENLSER